MEPAINMVEEGKVSKDSSLNKEDPVYSLAQAFEYCRQITTNHYENFPVASFIVPKKLRPYICAVYAFSRLADDFADEREFEGVRMAKLQEWEFHLRNISTDKEVTHPVFIALKETIQKFDLPVSLFSDLLTAFKMDVVVSRYDNFDQILNYCHYSANPVGRIILYLMGYPAPKLFEYSDHICTALQLANFWQDVGVDLEKNRIYIPKEDLIRFGYSEEDLKNKVYNNSFKRLIFFQVERTMDLFKKGKPLCDMIPGRLGFELRLTWLGGVSILEKILKSEGNVFQHRPTLKKWDALKIVWGSLGKKKFRNLKYA
jgi:phytoene synthase